MIFVAIFQVLAIGVTLVGAFVLVTPFSCKDPFACKDFGRIPQWDFPSRLQALEMAAFPSLPVGLDRISSTSFSTVDALKSGIKTSSRDGFTWTVIRLYEGTLWVTFATSRILLSKDQRRLLSIPPGVTFDVVLEAEAKTVRGAVEFYREPNDDPEDDSRDDDYPFEFLDDVATRTSHHPQDHSNSQSHTDENSGGIDKANDDDFDDYDDDDYDDD